MQYASPENAGWSSDGIAAARAHADSLGVKAVMLIHRGAIVTEWGRTRDLAPIASIRKSLFSALFGIAVAEGQIDTSATLADLGIDDTPPLTEAEKRARVADLLTTSSGVYHAAAGESPQTQKPERGSAAPGEQWYYNNWDFNVLGTIYEQETGTRIYEAFEAQIADPIGMEDYDPGWGSYRLHPDRSEHPSYPLWMTARDLARFGLLYLRDGRWEDRQVVPADWVAASRRIHIDVPYEPVAGYGLSWWIPSEPLQAYGTYLAAGVGSQSIMILPALDIVFVLRASAVLERGVSGLEVRDILMRLLDARAGTASDHPELIPWSD
jgi:CubicO group peptidase (beta-lactamase class C family)